nr:ribosomal RNA processing protein 1 homolog B-like [Odocoileus virginianus texanus]
MAPAMQPAEIQFAQRLASHEKGIRDRAMRKLRQYISVKTQRETGGRRRSAAHMAAGRGSLSKVKETKTKERKPSSTWAVDVQQVGEETG